MDCQHGGAHLECQCSPSMAVWAWCKHLQIPALMGAEAVGSGLPCHHGYMVSLRMLSLKPKQEKGKEELRLWLIS